MRSTRRRAKSPARGVPDAAASPFSPFQLGELTLPNRFIKSATHDGASFEALAATYVRLAKNGVPLMTVAYVGISPTNKTFDTQHHIADSNIAQWSALCAAVKAAGGRLSAQLHHPGLFCMSTTGVPIGPSFFYLPSKLAWPRAMAAAECHAVKAEYVAAARRCVAAGFACLELHCGHGYLLSQFLTPLINRRTDSYGGSTAARALPGRGGRRRARRLPGHAARCQDER